MIDKNKIKKLEAEKNRLDKVYGYRTGALGTDELKLEVFSTGILALDYALGTGGWPKGYCVEVFGPEDIGKSSAIGLSAIRGAQAEGGTAGIIALEPNFDPKWAAENGVDTSGIIISRPSDGETAFNILYDWVNEPLIDVILFDSIGALLKATEIEVEGKKAKPSQAGQSPLITWGVKRVVIPAWKNNKVVMFLNQARDKMGSPYPILDSPGGHALKHSCSQRVQLKPGGNRVTATVNGDTGVVMGQDIVAEVVRNKLAKGTRQRGVFKYWQKEHQENGDTVGVDIIEDIIRTGKKCGVIEGSGYLESELWEGKLHGKPALKKHLRDNPETYDKLRSQVLGTMMQREGVPDLDYEPTVEDDEAVKDT